MVDAAIISLAHLLIAAMRNSVTNRAYRIIIIVIIIIIIIITHCALAIGVAEFHHQLQTRLVG